MKSDGKQLESLVAFVEETLVPEGFSVTKNERIYNDEGIQIAEFDIEIRGQIGSTDISWLIECRDRPATGPAPGSWIEQLVGRRTRFGFNKVTAVSTTGFATGAAEFALSRGIEIREVNSLEPEDFSDWLYIRHIVQHERLTSLEDAKIIIDDSEGDKKKKALEVLLSKVDGNEKMLKSSRTGELTSPALAFSGAAAGTEGIFENLEVNGEGVTVKLKANYTDDDHFIIETEAGKVKVMCIVFTGKASLKCTEIPLFATSEYRKVDTGDVVSQVASFAPQSIHGMKFSTEMHRMGETGETHILLRRLDDDA